MAQVTLITGANIGDVEAHLTAARELLGLRVGAIVACSGLYWSAPWGFEDSEGGDFGNQVLVVETELSPVEVLRQINLIESELGRDRDYEVAQKALSGQLYHSRKIDIDILLYDSVVVDEPSLVIPHPRMGERQFVLEPLCEVMGEALHPIVRISFGEMLNKLKNE